LSSQRSRHRPQAHAVHRRSKSFAAGTGHCTDDTTRKFVTDQLAAFERCIVGVSKMKG
jgi:chromate reductase